jgi:flagellar biosynthesis protein FlhG
MATQSNRLVAVIANRGRAGTPSHTGGIDDLLTGAHTIDEVLVPIRRGVHFVPGSACTHEHREFGVREQAALIWALDAITGQVDVVLIDTAAGLSAEVATLARAAHHLVVVVRDEPATPQHAQALIARLSTEHAIGRFKVLANQTRTLSAGTALYHKFRQGGDGLLNVTVEYAGSVPHDNCVRRALHTQQSLARRPSGECNEYHRP